MQGCSARPPPLLLPASDWPEAGLLDQGWALWSRGGVLGLAERMLPRLAALPAGSVLAVAAPAGPGLLAAYLSAGAAGLAFAPVAPDGPPARTKAVLDLLGARAVASGAGAELELRPLAGHGRPVDAMYVIFTSGSTGRPKGIRGSMPALAWYVDSRCAAEQIGRHSRLLLASAASFDPSLADLFTALRQGCVLGLPPAGPWLDLLPRLLAEMAVTHITTTPGVWATLPPDPPGLVHLASLALGGDRLPAGLAQSWAGRLAVANTYGVTEATVYQTRHRCTREQREPVPAGVGLASVLVAVVSVQLPELPLPAGASGQVVLGGPQLSSGYLTESEGEGRFRRPEWAGGQVAAREGRGEPAQVVYFTGDGGRMNEAGELHLLGRLDNQVKIRGVRFELGEIEAAVGLAGCCAAVLPPASVVVYVALAGGEQDGSVSLQEVDPRRAEALARRCAERLPVACCPKYWVALQSLPLTAHGAPDEG